MSLCGPLMAVKWGRYTGDEIIVYHADIKFSIWVLRNDMTSNSCYSVTNNLPYIKIYQQYTSSSIMSVNAFPKRIYQLESAWLPGSSSCNPMHIYDLKFVHILLKT